MKLRNAVFAAVLLALGPGVSVQAAQSNTDAGSQATAAQVRELMDVVGVKRMMTQMMGQMTVLLKHQLPCAPESALQSEFAGSGAFDDLLNKMIPVYQQHFTSKDIDGLLAFYRSPLGQKLVQAQPQIMQQGMQIGRRWGLEHGNQLVSKLKQQGLLDANGQCKAPKKDVVPPVSE